MNASLQADDRVDDQVRFSTESNLLTIPLAIINQHQIVFNAEMQLLSNGNFVLTKYSEQPPVQINLDEPFILEITTVPLTFKVETSEYQRRNSG